MRIWIFIFCIVSISSMASAAEKFQSYPQLEFTAPGVDDGEVLIDFKNDEQPSVVAKLLSGLGIGRAQYSWFSQDEKWLRLSGAGADVIDRIRSSGEVEAIEPNYYMTAFSVPNDPYYKHQWHLDIIGMPQAWDYPAGATVTVAVIDTGIAYENYKDRFRVEDLGEAQFVSPYNFVKGNEHADDDHGHGTHVAGTIAQLTNNGVGVAGVAPRVKLMPLKVLNSYGYGTISDIASAIRYAADHGARVINMSLGGPFPSFILHKAVKYAHDKGVVVVCAAGNNGRSGLSYPARYKECISVSAVRFDKKLSWYSSYGNGVTISAPGGDMNVDQNGDGLMDGVLQNTLNPQNPSEQGYFLFQGTSMATPHVAAAAALLISHGIEDPEAVRRYLQSSATEVEGGSSEQYGAGVLNVHAALRSAYLFRNLKILALGTFLLIVLLTRINRKRSAIQKVPVNLLTILGLLLGSSGLFFLRLPYVENIYFLTHPVAEWQWGVFGASASVTPLFFSALPALAILLFAYPWKRIIPFAFAFSCALAAFLLYQSWSPVADIVFLPGRLVEFGWLVLNALLSASFALIASFRLR
jgi:serine protease